MDNEFRLRKLLPVIKKDIEENFHNWSNPNGNIQNRNKCVIIAYENDVFSLVIIENCGEYKQFDIDKTQEEFFAMMVDIKTTFSKKEREYVLSFLEKTFLGYNN